MKDILRRYATPFTLGLFLVSLVSGVALFFKWEPRLFHSMHEWLSMLLILPFVAHIWRNWRSMTGYLKHLPLYLALILSLGAAAAFVIPGEQPGAGRSAPPQAALGQKLLDSPVSTAAPVFGMTTEELSAKLAEAGFTVASPGEKLTAVAAAAGKPGSALAATLSALP